MENDFKMTKEELLKLIDEEDDEQREVLLEVFAGIAKARMCVVGIISGEDAECSEGTLTSVQGRTYSRIEDARPPVQAMQLFSLRNMMEERFEEMAVSLDMPRGIITGISLDDAISAFRSMGMQLIEFDEKTPN